ncbi:UNVERIFIED_CONTAM: hypothetical protein RMT77_003374 [Armadillidium vulgare]
MPPVEVKSTMKRLKSKPNSSSSETESPLNPNPPEEATSPEKDSIKRKDRKKNQCRSFLTEIRGFCRILLQGTVTLFILGMFLRMVMSMLNKNFPFKLNIEY